MPIIIIKREKPPPPPPPQPRVAAAPVDGRPQIAKAIKVGEFTILPDLDVHDVAGRTKFLVHLTKASQVYRIRSYDEETGQLKCRSVHGAVFDTKVYSNMRRLYMVVMCDNEALNEKEWPTAEVVAVVQGLLQQTPSTLAEVTPEPEPPKKGGVTITKRQK